MTHLTSIVEEFLTQFAALATLIASTIIFMFPLAIKFTGKAIGFVKSLMGTGGRRRR